MGNHGIGVQREFTPATQRKAMRRRNHGKRRVFQGKEQMLTALDITIHGIKSTGGDHAGNKAQIRPNRKGARMIIAQNQRLKPARILDQNIFQQVKDPGIKAVHLGLGFETGNTIAHIPDLGHGIAEQPRAFGFGRIQQAGRGQG